MIGWIDSHAHIMSDPLFENFDAIKKEALEHGVRKICIILGSLSEIERAFETCGDDPMFDFAIGVHPTTVQDVSEEEFQAMMEYLDKPQVKFVGEIGLDFYWDTTHMDLQIQRFIQQIAIANEKGLPIAIHTRNAAETVLKTITEHPVTKKGIAHCFSETVEMATAFEALGFHLGIGGVFTFKNGDNVRAVVDAVRMETLITETDSPYLAPVPMRGKENHPAYVSYVGKALATHLGLSEDAIQSHLWKNYEAITQK